MSEEGIVEAPGEERELLVGELAELVFDERAVEPDRVFAEVAALALIGQAHALVRGDGRVVLAGGDADAGAEALAEHHVRAEAGAQTHAVAVLIDVELRRKLVAGGVEGRAGVDGVEVRERAAGVVAVAEEVALVAHADVGERADLREPVRNEIRRGPAFGLRLRHDLVLHLLADLRFHDAGHVGHAHRAVFLGRGRRHGHGLLGGGVGLRDGGLRGGGLRLRELRVGLGLLDEIGGVFLRQNAFRNESIDQVNCHVLRRSIGRGRRRHAETVLRGLGRKEIAFWQGPGVCREQGRVVAFRGVRRLCRFLRCLDRFLRGRSRLLRGND